MVCCSGGDVPEPGVGSLAAAEDKCMSGDEVGIMVTGGCDDGAYG